MLRSICFHPETTPFCVMANDENVTRFIHGLCYNENMNNYMLA